MKHDFIKVIFAAALFAGCSKMSPEEKMSLHPKFPVVEGRYQITKDWTVELPGQFNRRLEDESLVIWRPGFTIWTTVWNNDHDETPEQRLSWIQAESNPDAHSQETENDGGLIRYAYRLQEESDDERRPAFYCFAIGQGGHIQMAIYFDREDDLATAKRIWLSLKESTAGD